MPREADDAKTDSKLSIPLSLVHQYVDGAVVAGNRACRIETPAGRIVTDHSNENLETVRQGLRTLLADFLNRQGIETPR